ncbi:MAG: hypothetical protein HYS74_01545 [Parcubacteria group bacterium]|nr:hypothetical protein [Parcubacteria group bacterium]
MLKHITHQTAKVLHPKKLHHAYCVEGDRETAVREITRFCEGELGVATRGNPDFWRSEHGTFGIDESRALKERAAARPVSDDGRKIFLIAAYALTHEAQNALLKLFEDPTPRTHFFLVIPDAGLLLPTLRSRLEIIPLVQHPMLNKLAGEFLGGSFPERCALVKEIIDEKDKHSALMLLNGIETILHERMREERPLVPVLEEIEKCRGYLQSNAPSVKMIMEHLALVIPPIDKKAP